jgi:hypothetical protein
MPPQWYTYVPMSPAGQTVDVSLYGESLQALEECVASLRGSEWLLGWALRLMRVTPGQARLTGPCRSREAPTNGQQVRPE